MTIRRLKYAFFTVLSVVVATVVSAGPAAMLAEAMREYQVRHRIIHNGENLDWPEVFDCRLSGIPAPPNPPDDFYNEEVVDPQRLAELTTGLVDLLNYFFLRNFVSNYDGLVSGNAFEVEFFSSSKLGIPPSGTQIQAAGSLSTLSSVLRALNRLNYMSISPGYEDLQVKNGVGIYDTFFPHEGYMENARKWALSEYGSDHFDYSASRALNGWIGDTFREPPPPNHAYYAVGEYSLEDNFNSGGFRPGFYERQWLSENPYRWTGVWTAQDVFYGIAATVYAEIRIIKGTIRVPGSATYAPGTPLDLFIKVDDLGQSADPLYIGDSGRRNPPSGVVDGKYSLYASSKAGSLWEWSFNDNYTESYIPVFEGAPDRNATNPALEYRNGWAIVDAAAIIKPDLTPAVDMGITCCGPCTGCPPGTASYANSSVQVVLTLGQGNDGKSAGYLLLHEQKPSSALNDSAALKLFPGSGTVLSGTNEPGVSRTILAPTARMHLLDDVDGDPLTHDWQAQVFHEPYTQGDSPYHTLTFEAIYAGDGSFDRFFIEEAAALGNHVREYVWRTETVQGVQALGEAVLDGSGGLAGFTLIEAGSRYFESPSVTLSGGDGSGASATATTASGVISEIVLLSGGSNYTSAPSVEFVGDQGSGAAIQATILNGVITGVTIEDIGWGYFDGDPVTVTDSGGGSGADLRIVTSGGPATGIASVAIVNGGSGYTVNTELSAQPLPGYPVASLTPIISSGGVGELSIVDGGTRYFGNYQVSISGTGTGAEFEPVFANGVLADLNQINAGTGYDGSTTVELVADPTKGGSGAIATSVIENGSVVRIDIETGGSNYPEGTGVMLTGGGGSGAEARVVLEDNVVTGLQVTDPGSGYTTLPSVAIDPPDAEIRQGWELIFYDSDGTTPLRREYKRTGTADDGNPAEIVTIHNGDGTRLKETITSFAETYYFGRKASKIEEKVIDTYGNGNGSLYTYLDYYGNPGDSSFGLLQQSWRSDNGPWEQFDYDESGRITRKISQRESSRKTDLTATSWVDETRYLEEDLNADSEDEIITVTTRTLAGAVVSRSFDIWWSDQRSGDFVGESGSYTYREKWVVQVLDETVDTPQEAIAGTDTLVTRYRYYTGGAHDGKLRSVLSADGDLTIHEYSSDGLTQWTYSGKEGAIEDTIGKVTLTEIERNGQGHIILETKRAWPQEWVLTLIEAVQTDAFGRVTQTELKRAGDASADPSMIVYSERSAQYSCCGLDSETNEEGIVTTYQYDGLKRVRETTRGGITTVREYDALGRIRSETINGLRVHEQDYDSRGLVEEERTLFKDSLVSTTRTRTTEDPLLDVETVNYPDGSWAQYAYYKDGSLYRQTGSAVTPLERTTGITEDGLPYIEERTLAHDGQEYVPTAEFRRSVNDLAGRLFRVERAHPDGTGSVTAEPYDYRADGQLNWVEDADGIRTTFTYNSYGEPSGSFVNDPATGLLESTGWQYASILIDGVVHIAREESHLSGDDPSEQITLWQTPDGLLTLVNQYGLETRTVIELDGVDFSRRETTTLPDGTHALRVFDTDGRLWKKQKQDTTGAVLTDVVYGYDAFVRVQTATDARSGTTTFLYYDDGRPLSTTTPDPDPALAGEGVDAQATSFDYAFEPGGGIRTTTTLADEVSKRISVTDALGRPQMTYGPGQTPVRYTYDAAGRIKTLTTWRDFDEVAGAPVGGSAVTEWVYNPAGLLEQKRFNVTGPESYEPGAVYAYSAAGRLQTRTWARGVATRYNYNDEGLLWQADHHDDGNIEETFLYDAVGRVKQIEDASGSRTLGYSFGQVDVESYSGETLHGLSIDREFDLVRTSGFDLRFDGASLHEVGIGYHPVEGRMDSISSGIHSASYTYHSSSNHVDEVRLKADGAMVLRRDHEWDLLDRLTQVEAVRESDGQVLSRFAYSHDDLNRRTRATLEDGSYWAYGPYDAWGQLEGAAKHDAGGAPVPGLDFGYTYDDVGNRSSSTRAGATSHYTADALNQYGSVSQARTHDILGEAPLAVAMTANGQPLNRDGERFYAHLDLSAEGPLEEGLFAEIRVEGTLAGAGDEGRDAVREAGIERTYPPQPFSPVYDADGNLLEDGHWAYTWNAANRLASMETHPVAAAAGVPVKKLEFAYDSQGRRFEKKVHAWNGQAYILQSTTRFVYDGWNLIAELNDQGDLICGYTWGTDLCGTLQGATSASSGPSAGGVGGLLLVYDAASGSTLAPFYDSNGNVMGYVDMGSGAVVADFAYGPFGEPIRATGPMADVVVFRFSTKYTDSETGLLYYGFRYYDPESGRWLSRDPLGEAGGINLYGFVWNDAINSTDYLGLFLIAFDDGKSVPANILDFMAGYFGGLGQGTVNLGNAAARVPGNAYQSIKFGAGLATMDPVAQAQLVAAFRDIYSFTQLAASDPCFRQALWDHLKQQITDPDVLADLAANVTVDAALSALTLGLGKAAAAGKLGNYLDDLASIARKSGATNKIPDTLARVVPDSPITRASNTLGRPDASDVFVTAADDIRGLNASQIAERLTIPQSPSGFRAIEFPTPTSGLASPINRLDDGFIGGGRTAGGAREFVLPNGSIPSGATTRTVP